MTPSRLGAAQPGELREDESFTTALYRAAIGPVSTDYYLALFTAWEASGQWRPQWNTAAGLWTLGWLGFRQMGGIALVYAGAVVSSLLIVLGIGSLVFSLSREVQMVILSLCIVVAIVVPGLLGNRWFHLQCRKRMDVALAAHTDVAQACSALVAQSSQRKRAMMIGGAQLGMLLALGGAALQFNALLHQTGLPMVSASTSPQSASGRVKELTGPTGPASAAASAPVIAAAPPAIAASAAPVAAPVTVPVAAPARVTAPVAAVSKPALQAPPKTAKIPAKETEKTSVKQAVKQTTSTATAGGYGVNVGLFAKESNALHAREKLEAAKLTVHVDTLKMPRGPRIRVRVGPYSTQAQADAAVIQIRALGLDAITYRE